LSRDFLAAVLSIEHGICRLRAGFLITLQTAECSGQTGE
jgi:hypothetical protein